MLPIYLNLPFPSKKVFFKYLDGRGKGGKNALQMSQGKKEKDQRD